MNAELEAIKDSWDKNTGDGRDDEGTRALADKYVADHPEQFEGLRQLEKQASDADRDPIPDLVNALSVFRNAGMAEEQWRVETYLLHRFPPQNIGGEYRPSIRPQSL